VTQLTDAQTCAVVCWLIAAFFILGRKYPKGER
jgi:uncharacterized membrane protein (GlpM family)